MRNTRCACLILATIMLILLSRTNEIKAATKTLTVSNETLMAGKTLTLRIDGVKNTNVKWKSSKTSIATVNKNGVVKAKKAGITTITGKYSGITFKTKIKVNKRLGKNVLYDSNGIKIIYAGTTSDYEKNFVKFKVKNMTGKDLHFVLNYLMLDNTYVDGGGTTYQIPSNFTSTLELTGREEKDWKKVMKSPKKVGIKFEATDFDEFDLDDKAEQIKVK